RIRHLFGGAGGAFNLVPFPAGPYEVPDEVGDGRPLLVVMGYEALAISLEPKGLPPEIDDIFKHKGADNRFRDFKNNLVFILADAPGNGRVHVARVLRENKKLLDMGDQPDAPGYVRDQTPLKIKGEISTRPSATSSANPRGYPSC